MANFLDPILTPFGTIEYTVEHSYIFVDRIQGIVSADNYYMASFDFESLYTNIPLSETINICLTFIYIDRTDSFMNFSRLFLNIDGISYF